MTQTITSSEPPSEAANTRFRPTDILMNLIIALLAPMFLGISAGDVNLARMAAIETVNAYRVQNHADLIAVAQIVAFGLAALGSLSMSMADDISLSMALRLRANANGLNRSAEQNRRALQRSHHDDPAPHRMAPEPHRMAAEPEPEPADTFAGHDDLDEAEVFLSVAAVKELAAEAEARLWGGEQTVHRAHVAAPAAIAAAANAPALAEQRNQAMWAIAMAKEAAVITASIPSLPPAERNIELMRVSALCTVANELLTASGSRPLE
jgi:hypothetical protein